MYKIESGKILNTSITKIIINTFIKSITKNNNKLIDRLLLLCLAQPLIFCDTFLKVFY